MVDSAAEQIAISGARDADDVVSPHIRPMLVGAFAALFLALDIVAYHFPDGIAFAVVLLQAAVIVFAAILNARMGLLFLTVSVLLAEDISRYREAAEAYGFTTLMSAPLLGVALGNWAALAVIAITLFFGLLRWLDKQETLRFTGPDYAMMGVLLIYVVASIHGYRHLLHSPRTALNDLNLPLMAAGLFLAVRVRFREPAALMRLFQCIIAATAAKAVVWTVYYFLDMGQEIGFSVWTSLESGRPLVVLLLLFGLVLQQRHLRLRPGQRAFALGIVLIAAFNLLVHITRMAWIEAAYGGLVLLILGRIGDKARWILAGALAAVVVIGIVLVARPDALYTIGYFASTLDVTDPDKVLGSHSTMVRIYEFRNITAQLWHNGRLLFGEGPGSSFTDSYYPFPVGLDPMSDYTWEEIQSRQFANAHGLLQNLLLNTGFGGMVAYLLCMLGVYVACFRAFFRLSSPGLQAVALALAAYLPSIIYDSWSPKNNMTLGILIAVVAGLAAIARDQHRGAAERAPGTDAST